jgi:hypothetical protein
LQNGTAGALAEVVASPLGLWLLRVVPLGAHHDAQPLIDPDGYPVAAATAEAARAAPRGPQPARPIDLLLDGLSMRITGGHAQSFPTLRSALMSIRSAGGWGGGDVMRWFWLAFPIAQESAAHELWDDEAWHRLATDAVRLAHGAGALAASSTWWSWLRLR